MVSIADTMDFVPVATPTETLTPEPLTPETLTRGHKKKARTRQLLLDAALEVLAEQGEAFSVADLATRAGVSHGTFYNYFTDREQLIDALVPHVVGRFAERMAVEIVVDDPAERFARISALALEAGARESKAVRVGLRLDAVQRGLLLEGPLAHLRQDLADGYAMGRFDGAPDDGTLDVVLGSLLLAARRVAEGERSAEYRRTVLRRLLQALGIAADEAIALAAVAVATA
jgi:AcrR family transcriptional regulator